MSIIGNIFKDEALGSLLDRVDTLVNNIEVNRPNINEESETAQTIKDFISSESQDSNINELFSNIVVPAERLNRYIVYDELFKTIQLIKKILTIYQNYILQKDLISGKIILYKPNEQSQINIDNQEYQEYEKFTDNILNYYKIKEQLKTRIIPHLLRYGDYFIELVDLYSTNIEVPRPDILLSKNINYLNGMVKNSETTGKIHEDNFNNVFSDLICEIDESPNPVKYQDLIEERFVKEKILKNDEMK